MQLHNKVDGQLNPGPESNRRSTERAVIPSNIPIYIQTSFNGAAVRLLVEDLSVGGALLVCSEDPGCPDIGQYLSGALILPGGTVPVDVTVRWRLWPKVGVQFIGASRDAVAQIARLIESVLT